MIDYVMAFTNQAAAKADPVMAPYLDPTGTNWRLDMVIPGSQSWNPANDSTVPPVPPATQPTIVHSYASGWWCVIAVPARVPALESDNNFVLCLDRDAAASGAPLATYVKKFNPTLFPSIISLQNTCRFQPVFMGSSYPHLGVQ